MSATLAVLTPIKLGNRLLSSRIVFGAHTNNMASGGEPNARQTEYLRARNGAAMVVVEPIPIHPTTIFARGNIVRNKLQARLYPLQALAAAVKAKGAVGILHFIHLGQHGDGDVSFHPNWSPSGLPSFIGTAGSHAMDASQIEELIDGFVQSAMLAKTAGFDGVELFANYQGLIEQFWSPWTNRRRDVWGSSFDGRMKFSTQILTRIKQECGSDFITGLAISHLDAPGVTLGIAELVEIVICHDRANLIDYVSCGTGGYLDTTQLVPAAHRGESLSLPLAAALKRAEISALVQAESGFRDIQQEERAIQRGDADLISMVRAQIADPSLVDKLRDGRRESIKPCLGCNQKCIGRRSRDRWISCVVNPVAGREFSVGCPVILKRKRSIAVIGSGPAGLEFASEVSTRGASVTVYESAPSPGGLPAMFGRYRFQLRWGIYISWLTRSAIRNGVQIKLKSYLTEEEARSFVDDVVVWACGASRNSPLLQRSAPRVGEIASGRNKMDVVAALSNPERVGPKILFIDDHFGWPGLGGALELAERGSRVTIATGQPAVGRDLGALGVLGDLRRAFASAGGEEITDTHLLNWDDGQAVLVDGVTGRVRNERFDTLVWASVPVPPLEKVPSFALPENHHVIGDALAPRDAAAAIYDANELARLLWQ